MAETDFDALREELATLEEAESLVSAERRRLHHQIDSGFATESTRARERQVSAERRQMHQRIDALRELLGVKEQTAGAAPTDWVSPGFSRLERPHALGS